MISDLCLMSLSVTPLLGHPLSRYASQATVLPVGIDLRDNTSRPVPRLRRRPSSSACASWRPAGALVESFPRSRSPSQSPSPPLGSVGSGNWGR
jgi:hypothetical protein